MGVLARSNPVTQSIYCTTLCALLRVLYSSGIIRKGKTNTRAERGGNEWGHLAPKRTKTWGLAPKMVKACC